MVLLWSSAVSAIALPLLFRNNTLELVVVLKVTRMDRPAPISCECPASFRRLTMIR
jgi:hypothetical protein